MLVKIERMVNSREAIRKELEALIAQGNSLIPFQEGTTFSAVEYQRWYTSALSVVGQLLPDRLSEFEALYKLEKRKTIDCSTYTISDFMLGLSITHTVTGRPIFDQTAVFLTKLKQQVAILTSANARLDLILSDITGILRADLFDDEIDAARSLLDAKHLRAAGTVAGVVLETHLSSVCSNHNLTIPKKESGISDYNDVLKKGGVLDVPNWRWIQRLGDIRNLCAHAKSRDPTAEEVEELITGVEKATKTLF